MRRQGDAVADGEGSRQRQQHRIDADLLRNQDDGGQEDDDADGLTGEDQMAEGRDEHDDHEQRELRQSLQIELVEDAVEQEGRGAGSIQSQTGRISAGGEDHQIPRNLGFLPIEHADVGHIEQQGSEDSDHNQAHLEAEERQMVAVGRPQEDGHGEDDDRADLGAVHLAQRLEFLTQGILSRLAGAGRRGGHFAGEHQLTDDQRAHQGQNRNRHAGDEPVAPGHVHAGHIQNVADSHDLAGSRSQDTGGGDVVEVHFLNHQLLAEVALTRLRLIDLQDHHADRQEHRRTRRSGRDDEGKQKIDDAQRDECLLRGGTELGDDEQRQALGHAALLHTGGDDERSQHQPDNVLTEDGQRLFLRPATGQRQHHDRQQRGCVGRNRLGNPKNKDHAEDGQRGLTLQRQGDRRGHGEDRGENKQRNRDTRDLHPLLKRQFLFLNSHKSFASRLSSFA